MDVFVKSFTDYRVIKKAIALSSTLVLDSLEADASTVTINGNGINYSDVGNWMICEGNVFLISKVKPSTDKTTVTLLSPLDVFSRLLELQVQPTGQTIGGFVAGQLTGSWIRADDAAYAISYLVVSDSDTTPYVAPDLDDSGCFSLADYCRLMRKSYHVSVRFIDERNALRCVISRETPAFRQISFDDGKSQLQNVDYAASGLAKITVLHDIETGEKDAEGNKIYRRERSTWYLSELGEISQLIPEDRATGEWGVIYIKGEKVVEEEVLKAFAKNKSSHKLTFWSTLDLSVQTPCAFMVHGELLRSYISYKQKNSDDNRFYYKSGELATTATEKLRGAMK